MFTLATPWVLMLLPLPLLFRYLMPKAPVTLPTALKIPFFAALAPIIDHEKYSIATQSLLLPGLIWLSLILALSGPRWVGEPKPINREGYNIMMALDLSGSMEIPDMVLDGRPASRLSVVKRAGEQFVHDRPGDKIGLILFGTRAYLQTPLTYDHHTILLRFEDATAGLAGKTTSIGDAVGLAVKRLENAPEQGRIIILLTDGANNSGVLDPLKAAELAHDDQIKIYTIGLGSETDPRALVNGFFMQNATADLDETTLKKMADMTGGRYFRATDTQSLHAIYKTINQLEAISQEQDSVRPQKEYYPWFISFALMLCFYWLLTKTKVSCTLGSLIRAREALKS